MIDILSDMPWEVVLFGAFIIMLFFVFLKDFDDWLDK